MLFGGGLEEDEFEAVMGCDSAAGAGGISLSVGFCASITSEGDPGRAAEGSLGCCGSCIRESVPFTGGAGACGEPETLERRDGSFVMSILPVVGFDRVCCVARIVFEALPARQSCEKRWGSKLSTDSDRASTHQSKKTLQIEWFRRGSLYLAPGVALSWL